MTERLDSTIIPAEIERSSLQELINRSIEDMDSTNKNTKALFAMIDVAFRYGFRMRPAVRKHLRKRIVVHTELIGGEGIRTNQLLSSSLFSTLRTEYSEF